MQFLPCKFLALSFLPKESELHLKSRQNHLSIQSTFDLNSNNIVNNDNDDNNDDGDGDEDDDNDDTTTTTNDYCSASTPTKFLKFVAIK